MADADHYAELGVSPDAEDVVIAAAYRALAQRYHPDKWRGDPQFAHTRMSRINHAYGVLRDVATRATYDRTRARPGTNNKFEPEDESESGQAFDAALAELESSWGVAASVYPDLNTHRASLAEISRQLAFQFVVIILEKRLFKDRAQIAKQLERGFLERYFGSDEAVQDFGLKLILAKNRRAALALNNLVSVMGSEVPASVLISKIERDFELTRPSEPDHQAARGPGVVEMNDNLLSDAVKLLVPIGVIVASVPLLAALLSSRGEPDGLVLPQSQSSQAGVQKEAIDQGGKSSVEAAARGDSTLAIDQAAASAFLRSASNHATVAPVTAPGPDRDQQRKTGYMPNAPRTATDGLSNFAVDNSSGGGDAVARLYLNGRKPAVRSFFVKRGEKFTAAKLTPGNYVLRYRYMGSEDTYEADRTFELNQVETETGTRFSDMTVTLYTVANGNMQTRKVASDSF